MRFVAWGVHNLYLLKINRADPIGFSFYAKLTNRIVFYWYPLEKICKISPPAL